MKKYLMLFTLLMMSSTAHAINWEMPAGTWTSRMGEGAASERISLEIRRAHRIRISFFDVVRSDELLIMDGRYQVSITKFSDYHSDIRFESIIQRLRGKERSLTKSDLLGVKIARGESLPFTFVFDCADGKNTVQLCLHFHDQVSCRNLERIDASCKGHPPAIDGALINAPPVLPSKAR